MGNWRETGPLGRRLLPGRGCHWAPLWSHASGTCHPPLALLSSGRGGGGGVAGQVEELLVDAL